MVSISHKPRLTPYRHRRSEIFEEIQCHNFRHGCKVAIASRNEQRLKEAAARFEEGTGQKVFYVKMDVRKVSRLNLN